MYTIQGVSKRALQL